MIFESRTTLRRKPSHAVLVTDTLTGETIGTAEDVSETGMQLHARTPLVEDAIYQLRFHLEGSASAARSIEAGAHVVWLAPTGAQGKSKSGLRFLSISEQDLSTLKRWTSLAASNH